jgi:hypothetical protein
MSLSRRKFLKSAIYVGAGFAVTATLGLPFADGYVRKRGRYPTTTTTRRTSSSTTRSTTSSDPTTSSRSSSNSSTTRSTTSSDPTTSSSSSSNSSTTDPTTCGMMALMYGFSGGTATGEAQWASLKAAVTQPGVQNVPLLVAVLPGEQQGYAEQQVPYMLGLLNSYPGSVTFIAYIDTCGGVAGETACSTYVHLSSAESLAANANEWYNTVQSYNPTGVKILSGFWFDDADWETNAGSISAGDYYGALQTYCEGLGLTSNLGNCGGLEPGEPGTLPYWNVWETPDYPDVAYLQSQASIGVAAKNLAWICNGASTFDASAVQAVAPYCGWCWVVPTSNDGDYYSAAYVSQLMQALAQIQ